MLLGCELSASQDGLSGRREGWFPEDLSQALCCRETLFYLLSVPATPQREGSRANGFVRCLVGQALRLTLDLQNPGP